MRRSKFGISSGSRNLKQCLLRVYVWRKILIPIILLVTLYILYHRKTFFRDLDYLVRPLWGHPARKGPEKIIPHFYAANVPPKQRCGYHGWTAREDGDNPRVFDAVIFSVELDILEIRMKELWSVVDDFVIVEATRTFMGKEKPLHFQENRERFAWAEEKIRHFVVTSLVPNPTVLFQNEANMRSHITGYLQSLGPKSGDLIIGSDVDEIPSAISVELVKSCKGYPRELHLLVDEYFYSFEFPQQTKSWRPHITTYDPASFWYHHIIMPDTKEMLADSGWHCSFCFRYISDFIFKMTSYSHSSLITQERYLYPDEIQRKICEGIDVFELPVEAYSIKDFIARSGKMKRIASTVGIPGYVVQQMEKFKFLLPGGCLREDYNGSFVVT